METSPGTVFPDTQPRLGEKRKLRGERGLQPPPIWFSAAGGAGEQPHSRDACVEGLGRASWGRPRSPPEPPGVGILSSASPPLGLRSAMPPPTPPCPRHLPRSLQTHSHPTPLSSSSSLLHPRNQSRITAVCLDPPGDTASSFQTVLVFTQPYWPRRCDPALLAITSSWFIPPPSSIHPLICGGDLESNLSRSFRADLSLHLEMTSSLAVLLRF